MCVCVCDRERERESRIYRKIIKVRAFVVYMRMIERDRHTKRVVERVKDRKKQNKHVYVSEKEILEHRGKKHAYVYVYV